MILLTQSLDTMATPELLHYLSNNLNSVTYSELFDVLASKNSLIYSVIFREALKSKEKKTQFNLTVEKAESRAVSMANNRRKRFVRRIYRKHPLFALEFIRERYPLYSENDLSSDLLRATSRAKKMKRVKSPSQFGLRVSQIFKLTTQLKFKDVSELERNTICNKIVGYQNGLKLKAPILLRVKYKGERREYNFAWNETENKIKQFVSLSNKCVNFEELDNEWSKASYAGN